MTDIGAFPQRLVEVANGMWAFRTLATALEIDLFKQLDDSGSMTIAEFAEGTEIERRPAEILLTACASLQFLETDGERFWNSDAASRYLNPESDLYFGHWIELCDLRAPAWFRLRHAIRHNWPASRDPHTGESVFDVDAERMLTAFWQGMHSLSVHTVHQFGERVDLSTVSRLLDLGGGSGTWSVGLCRRFPHLQATVFDLPFIIDSAQQRISEAALDDRITLVGGDFFSDDPLPGGYDAILLSMILHDWDEAANRRLLAKCHAALPPGGSLYVVELFIRDDRTGPADAALMSLNMLVDTEGRNYRESEYRAWLTAAGFDEITFIPLESAGANGVLQACKP